MKIQRIDLKKFGPFTDRALDFGAEAPDPAKNETADQAEKNERFERPEGDLHIVFGPNESGKSSSLRALRNLLYGIPTRTTDDFIHAGKDMRLGGTFLHSDGSALSVVRRRGKGGQALRDAADKDALDESVMTRLTGGMPQAQFESMFGIDHAGLVAGGQSLFAGSGEIGQILFAAGAGIADIQRIGKSLSDDADKLFLPKGSTQTITAGLGQLRDSQARLKDAEVSAAEWERLDQSLRLARAKKEEIEGDINQKQQLKNKLQRFKQAQPLISRRLELMKCLEQLNESGAIALPEDFAERSRDLQIALVHVTNEQTALRASLEKLDGELATMQVPTVLLERASVIEDLKQTLGSHLKAMNDRSTNIVVGLTQHENAMKNALKSLGHPPDITLCDSLRITVAQKALIRELAGSKSAVEAQAKNAALRFEQSARNCAESEAELSRLVERSAPESLLRVVKRIEQKGALEATYKQVKSRVDAGVEQIEIAVRKLMINDSAILRQILSKKDWTAFESLAVPELTTINRFDEDIDKYARGIALVEEKLGEADRDFEDCSQKLEQLRHEMDTPTEDDLKVAREYRERGWTLVKDAWQKSGARSEAELRAYLEEAGQTGSELSLVYENSVAQADNIGDRLRRESTQIAQRAALLASQSKIAQKRSDGSARLAKGVGLLKEIEEEWSAAWQNVQIKPLPPKEMRSWLTSYQDVVNKIRTLRDLQTSAQEQYVVVEEFKQDLSDELAIYADGQDCSSATLVALLERARQIIARVEAERSARELVVRDFQRYKKESVAVQQDNDAARVALEKWQDAWATAVKPLKLDGPVQPGQADAHIELLDSLVTHQAQAQQFATRLNGIDRDATNFTARVEAEVQLVAPELIDFPVEQAAAKLYDRLVKARANKERHDLLVSSREEKTEALQAAETKARQCADELELMCKEARCADSTGLTAAAESSKALRQAQNDLTEVQANLSILSGGMGLDEFVVEVGTIAVDDIDPRVAQLDGELEALGLARTQQDQSIGGDTVNLARINGGGTAAEAAEDAQAIMATIGSAAEHYARLQIARVLLKQCVIRYREKNQSPVLKRASEIFEKLTLGSFIGLREDYGEKGEAILVGVRRDSTLVMLSSMSEGTCDQAYLALRLASLEIYLEKNEALPFIVDDILVNFDDARSNAALRILSDLSRQTQVIFFTHHAHMLDLAASTLAKGAYTVHNLQKEVTEAVKPASLLS